MIPLPPTSMMFDGPQDEAVYRANGEEFLRIYRDLCGLKPDETMLDVGSGIGRKTIPLTGYLSPEGRYEGIDPVRVGVEWCQENITSLFPNFRFQHVDVRAPGYNPAGTIAPSEFRFPFDDETFDFVTLCSVFTHMQYDDMCHYLAEVHRVMKPGARCLLTWFLLNEATPKAYLQFPFRHDYGRMAQQNFPEQAIAFEQTAIDDQLRLVGLNVDNIQYGTWSGRSGLSYQDIVVVSKKV